MRRSLEEMLLEAGYEVSVAEDGDQALARLGDARPEVVLSDVRMPGLSGGIDQIALSRPPTDLQLTELRGPV